MYVYESYRPFCYFLGSSEKYPYLGRWFKNTPFQVFYLENLPRDKWPNSTPFPEKMGIRMSGPLFVHLSGGWGQWAVGFGRIITRANLQLAGTAKYSHRHVHVFYIIGHTEAHKY